MSLLARLLQRDPKPPPLLIPPASPSLPEPHPYLKDMPSSALSSPSIFPQTPQYVSSPSYEYHSPYQIGNDFSQSSNQIDPSIFLNPAAFMDSASSDFLLPAPMSPPPSLYPEEYFEDDAEEKDEASELAEHPNSQINHVQQSEAILMQQHSFPHNPRLSSSSSLPATSTIPSSPSDQALPNLHASSSSSSLSQILAENESIMRRSQSMGGRMESIIDMDSSSASPSPPKPLPPMSNSGGDLASILAKNEQLARSNSATLSASSSTSSLSSLLSNNSAPQHASHLFSPAGHPINPNGLPQRRRLNSQGQEVFFSSAPPSAMPAQHIPHGLFGLQGSVSAADLLQYAEYERNGSGLSSSFPSAPSPSMFTPSPGPSASPPSLASLSMMPTPPQQPLPLSLQAAIPLQHPYHPHHIRSYSQGDVRATATQFDALAQWQPTLSSLLEARNHYLSQHQQQQQQQQMLQQQHQQYHMYAQQQQQQQAMIGMLPPPQQSFGFQWQ